MANDLPKMIKNELNEREFQVFEFAVATMEACIVMLISPSDLKKTVTDQEVRTMVGKHKLPLPSDFFAKDEPVTRTKAKKMILALSKRAVELLSVQESAN